MPPRINLPPLTRILLALLFSLSILTGALRYRQWNAQHGDDNGKQPSSTPSSIVVPYLTVVPQLSLFYPWVFVTATFVETNLFTLIITAATTFYGGKYLERAWSSTDFGKFVLVVSIVPNFLAFVFFILWFAVTSDVNKSLTTICGGTALQAGFLVAFKQLVPEHTVTIAKGLIKIRVKHFPALFLLLNLLLTLLFGIPSFLLATLGLLTSWTYLRFYKPTFPDLSTNQSSSLKGDASETFAFAHFFPEPLHTPVAAVCEVVWNLLVTLRICTPFSHSDVLASNSRAQERGEAGLPSLLNSRVGAAGGGNNLPSSARAETERRRALALKALDQRLHAATAKAAQAGQGSHPPQQQASQATASMSGGSGNALLGETSFTPEGHEDRNSGHA